MHLGIDLGTSGVRCCVIDRQGQSIAQSRTALPPVETQGSQRQQDARLWWKAVKHCLADLPENIRRELRSLAIDGTSGTVLACDERGEPLAPALMYNDSRAREQAALIARIAPADSAAHGASSGLAKLLWLRQHIAQATRFLHQADWIASRFTGNPALSDENNALKTGYDPVNRRWPRWLFDAPLSLDPRSLPKVQAPCSVFAPIRRDLARTLGLSPDLLVHAGTTDSIAAFLAALPANARLQPGDAVTSLGSTLAIKVISSSPVFAPEYGIYSHRLGDHWLAGGASNSGGAALLRYFGDDEIRQLTPRLRPDTPTGLRYYPLPARGERFPLADPQKESLVTPEPDSRVAYFQGMLESIARIEHEGYEKLRQLGAEYPRRVFTMGGGARNPAWTAIRARELGCEVLSPEQGEAACGVARLAIPR